jgi:hypothetical protein
MRKWGEAAIFVKQQLDLRGGEHPVMLYAYGKSLFESGDMSGAVFALTKSLSLAQDEHLKENIVALRELALQSGGTVVPSTPVPASGPVTRDEFEAALEEFRTFISARKRINFWQQERKITNGSPRRSGKRRISWISTCKLALGIAWRFPRS